jgi:hypothetical protein
MPQWHSWKPQTRHRPEGRWRQLRFEDDFSVRVVGLKHRRDAVKAFVEGALSADAAGEGWGVNLQRDPENNYHRNAIAVVGGWMETRKRWFRDPVSELRCELIGYLPREVADDVCAMGDDLPIGAELYEMASIDRFSWDDDPLGLVIKIIVLVPSKRSAASGSSLERARAGSG